MLPVVHDLRRHFGLGQSARLVRPEADVDWSGEYQSRRWGRSNNSRRHQTKPAVQRYRWYQSSPRQGDILRPANQ